MDGVELETEFLLTGQSVAEGHIDFHVKDGFRPIVKRNVCYIVCGVLFNDKGEVLMMQEAKSSCYGKWYLPAGRMEQGETITEAVKREVLEETGLEFEPTTFLCIEVQGSMWYRFTLTGNVTGGVLKTEKDAESIKADWFSVKQIKRNSSDIPLRALDILKLISIGEHFNSLPPVNRHTALLPVLNAHTNLLSRLVCCHVNRETDEVRLLVSTTGTNHLPLAIVDTSSSFMTTVFKLFKAAFGKIPKVKMHGLLTVEHTGKPFCENDGICLCLLMSIDVPVLPELYDTSYTWHRTTNKLLIEKLVIRTSKDMTLPLIILGQ